MSSIKKQIIINQLNIPIDTANIIKSYLFYDLIESNSRHIKKLTNHLLKSITYINYKKLYTAYIAVGFMNLTNENLQLQCEICSSCGNYIKTNNSNNNISYNALCHCYDELNLLI